jgi:hypothetical protein
MWSSMGWPEFVDALRLDPTGRARAKFEGWAERNAGVVLYPGCGDDLLPLVLDAADCFLDGVALCRAGAHGESFGTHVLILCDYGAHLEEFPALFAEEGQTVPAMYRQLWAERGATVAIAAGSITSFALTAMRGSQRERKHLVGRTFEARVCLGRGVPSIRYQVVYFPEDTRDVIAAIDHFGLDVAVALLIKQGGFSAPHASEPQNQLVPRLLGPSTALHRRRRVLAAARRRSGRTAVARLGIRRGDRPHDTHRRQRQAQQHAPERQDAVPTPHAQSEDAFGTCRIRTSTERRTFPRLSGRLASTCQRPRGRSGILNGCSPRKIEDSLQN